MDEAARKAVLRSQAVQRGVNRPHDRASPDGLRNLRRAFLSSQPIDLDDWLFVPKSGTPYLAGTTVQILGSPLRPSGSGLLLPERLSRTPAPGDMIKTYITAEEVFGRRVGLEPILGFLGLWDREALLRVCAHLLVSRFASSWGLPSPALHSRERRAEGSRNLRYATLASLEEKPVDAERDAAIAGRFRDPYKGRLMDAVHQGSALLIIQSVLILAKRAIALSSSRPNAQQDEMGVAVALLAIQDDLDQHPDIGGAIDGIIGDPGAIAAVVQSHAFSTRIDARTLLGVFQLRWREMPEQALGRSDYVNLADTFAVATGVPLDDFLSVGLALWATTQRFGPVVGIRQLGLPLPRTRIDRGLQLLSATIAEARREIRDDETRLGAVWSFDALRRYPVIRLRGRRVLVLSQRLLLERIFSGLRYDVDQELRAGGNGKLARRASTFWRAMCEREAFVSLATLAPSAGVAKRLYDEADLQAAFGAQRETALPFMAEFRLDG